MLRQFAPLLTIALALLIIMACVPPFFSPFATNVNGQIFVFGGPFGFLGPFGLAGLGFPGFTNRNANANANVSSTQNPGGINANTTANVNLNVATFPGQVPGFNTNGVFNLNFNGVFNLNNSGVVPGDTTFNQNLAP